ncbi:MAG TPA: dockerin type I domain-containing protein, partial [Clostridia bacterium]
SGKEHLVVWNSGQMQDLGMVDAEGVTINSVNKSGIAVGQINMSNGITHGFIYSDGNINDISSSTNLISSLSKVNDLGQAVGYIGVDGSNSCHAALLKLSTTPVGIKGDVNNDGKINSTDVSLLKRYILQITTNINITNADMNGDGKINSTDYSLLKRALLGNI